TGGLGGVSEGQGEPRGGRGGRAVNRGVRDRLEGEPLQDLESHVLGELLSTASTARGDPQSQRGLEALGDPPGRRSRGADGRQDTSGATGGAAFPSRLLRVSSRKIGAGCSGHRAAAMLAVQLGDRSRYQRFL